MRGSKPGEHRGGRKKNTPNKIPTAIKEMILAALAGAGGEEGGVGYLKARAIDTPAAFMSLVGKVLPLQLTGDPESPIAVVIGTPEEFKQIAESMAARV